MKKHFVGLTFLLVAACSFFCSCGNIKNRNAGALEFDSVRINETVHLFADESKPACNLVVNMTYVDRSDSPKLKDSLNHCLQALCLEGGFRTGTPQEAVEAYKLQYVREYRKDLEPSYLKEAGEQDVSEEDFSAWFSYYKEIRGEVQLYHKHLLVYAVSLQEYTGGAHGMYTTHYYNFDLRTLKTLTLDDLFTGDYQDELTDLLWTRLLEMCEVSTREEAEEMGYGTVGELTPTENFRIGKDGITFYYNVYDIAPYSSGPTAIEIPYERFGDLLDSDVMVLKEVKE